MSPLITQQTMLIYNANIISPQQNITCGAVLIIDGIIKEIFHSCENLPASEQSYNAKGQMLVPGFIDIHTHGIGGADVCDATLEAIQTISKYKMQEGTTTYCPTTLTLSHKQLAQALKAVASYKKEEKYAKIAGIHLEGPFVNLKYIGAQNPEFARTPNIEEIKKLHSITPISIVTYAPELEGGLDFTKQLTALGIVPSAGHSAATSEDIKKTKNSGLKHLTHFGNQMTPLHHRAIGMVGCGLYDDDILIEIICDKVHLSTEMLQLVFKLKPINKIAVITDSLAATALTDGDYNLGGLPIYVKGNEARLSHSHNLAGSTLRMNIALKNIVEVTKLPIEQIIQTTSYNQAQSLGINNLGKIEASYIADLVLLDKNFDVNAVFINGNLM